MPFGYNGRVLRVDLTDGKTWVEEPSAVFYRTTWGGACLGAYYLLKEMPKGADAFSPENILTFASGVATGAPAPGLSRHTVIAKSPLTGGIGETQAGGWWGAELKFAGFDAVVIQGKASRPVYLWVHDGEAEIRDASHLWGKVTGEAQALIHQELGDEAIRVALIGPAGENLVRFACIANDLIFINGHLGLGAVMGSKNLKAVAVRGHKAPEVADRTTVERLSWHFADHFLENPVNKGTYDISISGFVATLSDQGLFSARNLAWNGWEGARKICGSVIQGQFFDHRVSCYACPAGCKRILKGIEKYGVNPVYGAPEMETIASLGLDCLIDDPIAILKGNEICNKYAMDSNSAGATIAFAMECFENGILTQAETGGLELSFGHGQAMLTVLEQIARREGLGDILAQGTRRAAAAIGRGAEKYAMQVKGQEMILHDPRIKTMLGLACAVSPTGPDIIAVEHDTDFDFSADQLFMDQISPLGLLERLDATDLSPQKLRMLRYLQPVFSFMDAGCFCIFAFAPVRFFKFREMVELLGAVTGWEVSLWELQKLGERRLNMFQVFNRREGISTGEDRLPDRCFEPIPSGPRQGLQLNKEQFEQAIQLYYQMMGWDAEGNPTIATLTELGL